VAGPCKEVLVVNQYVKDLVGDLPEEGGHLGSHDQPVQASVWVTVNRCWVVVWHVKVLCTSGDVKASLYGAHPVRGLAVVIVLLFWKQSKVKTTS
jgi:hypothetical protein